ncbi:LEA type 2 family protein [Halorussus litoreus]|uniref:LEA type 2 family protein n=1 Tax=Halorussus litoreus TaxID=1710536 RepID=UPI000E276EE1|nr:LEA type 2 family protein [Halorussus litoreus]
MGRLTSALFGSTLKILVAVVALLVVAVAAGFALGVLGTPSVAGLQNQFGEVTDETTEIRTELVVNNPNPFGVSLGGVSVNYDVSMNDVAMANGTKEGVSIGSGNSTLAFTTVMQNDRIPAWWASHVRNDEQTAVQVDAEVRSGTLGRSFDAPPVERQVSTDVISQFNSTETRPINASQPLVSDPVAYVNETGAQWGEVTRAETPIDLRMVVYNDKPVPMAITEIGYEITMNDVAVGNGSSDDEHVIEGHTEETIRTTTTIDNDKLDEWWVTHLENGQVTELRIDFYAEVEVAGETFRVPLEEMTYTETIETDVFGAKDASGGGDDGTAGDSEANEETTAGSGDEETTTPSDEETTDSGNEETTTASNEKTTTDDGILARGAEAVR